MKRSRKQKILEYPAVFSPAERGMYNVSFPDFPGCFTYGRNFKHAQEMAADVLTLWIEELRFQKEALPMHRSRKATILGDVRVTVGV